MTQTNRGSDPNKIYINAVQQGQGEGGAIELRFGPGNRTKCESTLRYVFMWTRTACVCGSGFANIVGTKCLKKYTIHYIVGTSPYDENGVKYLNEKVKMHEFLLGLGLGNQNDLLIIKAIEDNGKSPTR